MLMENRFPMMALTAMFLASTLFPEVSYAGPGAFGGSALGQALPSLLLRITDCSLTATEQECCSAARCTGDVLSNRDEHNCKDKSKGKSWHPASRNGVAALCRNRL